MSDKSRIRAENRQTQWKRQKLAYLALAYSHILTVFHKVTSQADMVNCATTSAQEGPRFKSCVESACSVCMDFLRVNPFTSHSPKTCMCRPIGDTVLPLGVSVRGNGVCVCCVLLHI